MSAFNHICFKWTIFRFYVVRCRHGTWSTWWGRRCDLPCQDVTMESPEPSTSAMSDSTPLSYMSYLVRSTLTLTPRKAKMRKRLDYLSKSNSNMKKKYTEKISMLKAQLKTPKLCCKWCSLTPCKRHLEKNLHPLDYLPVQLDLPQRDLRRVDIKKHIVINNWEK